MVRESSGSTFGLTSGRGRGTFKKRGRGGISRLHSGGRLLTKEDQRSTVQAFISGATNEASSIEDKFREARERDENDAKLGFERLEDGEPREGWLINMHPTIVPDKSTDGPGHASGRSAVDYYFIQDDASMFKVTIPFLPYFLVGCRPNTEPQVEEWLRRKYEGLIHSVSREVREDLKLANHLIGLNRTFIKISFHNVQDLLSVRRELLPMAERAQKSQQAVDTYAGVLDDEITEASMNIELEEDTWASRNRRADKGKSRVAHVDAEDCINDIREYDVPYHLRVAIDKDIRVGLWYQVSFHHGNVDISKILSRVKRAEPTVMAFDIETTKLPLKFPDAENDRIMMISYMIDGQGYLITNREIVSEDIEDFEYSPKDEYEGPFIIFNEADEAALLQRFFSHFREARPTVVATYNGDSFDFPFVETRAKHHGMSMLNEIGFARDNEGEYKSRAATHMDCFRWVKRDSYLPQGSQGLKAVTVAKLGYDPMELDPELMTPYAVEQPQILAQYSVSDAVATFYLYSKYVHPFIYSLSNIIPLNPDEVLRKGSGTLCETLLMVQAYQGNIVMPNRHSDPIGNTYEGHLLESETYVGGHVEALEAGVFRSDIATNFKVDPSAFDELIGDLDAALRFSVEQECKMNIEDVTNFDEVKHSIRSMLEHLRDNPVMQVEPLIYHLDVAAMYPNIMLSNRLQPDSVKDEAACAACDYNRPGMKCDKKMEWSWRGEFFPAKRDEVNMIRNALSKETFPGRTSNSPRRRYVDLNPNEQSVMLNKRVGDYSRKVYKKTHATKTVKRETVICQRENPFYIDTVRNFRDRRYEYKGLHKTWKKNLDKAQAGIGDGASSLTDVVEAKKMIILYDSLQLAHKCILNSFYGYVMRKGARWYSMEMAGITCLTGATIIQLAKDLVDRIGRPLELDTDGIWCMLPGSFPENFSLQTKSGKSLGVSYPCTMLNYLTHQRFTNHQYHTLDSKTGRYDVHSENSIFFELDGPYRAMILPSSKEEDKLLKKRYAVFNHDGSLAELKGFEVKRRGELQLIKDFQKQIFGKFLLGSTLTECYAAVASIADQWLDVLFSKGSTLHDEELIDLIAENKSMSKTLQEYGNQKSTAITTAKRLAEFLGAQMVKDKGLACKFIISEKPHGTPVTERAVPVAIFNAEPGIKQYYLRKFLRDNSLNDFDLRSILDWNYYIDRFGGVIQKLITIPAAMQRVPNPVPRIRHPDWLFRRVAATDDRFKQRKLTDIFKGSEKPTLTNNAPIVVEQTEKLVPLPVTEVVDDPIPDINQDYPAWVSVMKKKWKKVREERKVNGGNQNSRANRNSTISLFNRRSQSLASAVWDLVQITPTSRLGEFRMWVSVDGRLQSLKLRIPRTFYVHFKTFPRPGTFSDAYQVESVVRTLPRGKACQHLYKVTVAEDLFVEEETHFSSLLNHPNVDAVYEMQVPLEMRAMIQLGSTCALDMKSRTKFSRALDFGFDLSDLVKTKHPSIEKHKYLNDGKNIRWLYLWHGTKDGRHVMGLCSPENKMTVHVVDAAGLRQLPALDPMYKERLAKWQSMGRLQDGIFEYKHDIDMEVKVHTSQDRAWKTIARDLVLLRKASQAPTMLAICSARGNGYYESRLSAAVTSEFPVLNIPAAHQDDQFPTLGWQLYGVKRMLNCYLRTADWIKHWIRVSAHFDVPLANIRGGDVSMFAADLDFARRLTRNDMLLWWSETGADPDLGNVQLLDSNNAAMDDTIAKTQVEISRPGVYSNVVYEVTVGDLAINAVLQSGNVNNMEGSETSGSMAFDNTSHNLDEYAHRVNSNGTSIGDVVVTSQVFWTLKSMVKAWYVEKVRSKGPYSHALADGFWRWLSSEVGSERSCLFEPALARFVRSLMRKTMLQLLAECKRMGGSIVHANFQRMFILTSKPTAASAAAFGRYLMSALTSRDLFKHIDLDIVHHWDYLIWMDSANFGGVICQDPDAEETQQGDVSSKSTFQVDMNWNIATFLPETARHKFALIVSGFIKRLYEAKKRSSAAQLHNKTPLTAIRINAQQHMEGRPEETEQSMTGKGGLDMEEEMAVQGSDAATAKDLVNKWITRKMLLQTQELREQYTAVVAHALDNQEQVPFDWIWPRLPGGTLMKEGHESSISVALEYTKTVMAVLALHRDASVEVGVCRRNLLHLLGIGEFSPEAEFRQPCETLQPALSVICTFCNEDRVLDLCRDADLLQATEQGQSWRCGKCHAPYNRMDIDLRLCRLAHEIVRAYVQQDLRCSRCHTLRDTNLGLHCACSGAWSLTVPRRDVRRKLFLMQAIAQFHHLEALSEAIEELLEQCE